MKVSLRQAHKLVEKISARMGTIKLSAVHTVSIWDKETPAAVLTSLKAETAAQLERQMNLLGVRQDIRTSIQAVNSVEVNGLVAARKALLDQLSTLRHLYATIDASAISSSDALASKLSAERDSYKGGKSASIYGSTDTISVCVYDDAAARELDRKINELQLRVEAIEDQLTTSNSTGHVTISDASLAILRREGIVQ